MHINGKTKLGFFPLPVLEAKRLKNHLAFSLEFSAVDPCDKSADGLAFVLNERLACRTSMPRVRAWAARCASISAP